MATQKEIEEIKARVHIYDLVASYLPLKKSGNVYFGLCPFHGERSPSFSVNDDLGIFKCFGCQESGDIFTFLEKIESLTFPEAVEKLANISGTVITSVYGQTPQEASDRHEILSMNTIALDLFKFLLTSHKSGEAAQVYLTKRNINAKSIDTFQLGYDHHDILVRLLLKNGFTKDKIISYGLGVERAGVLLDKYRGRIIFPIHSITGEIVGFSGRILDDTEKAPKYLNSPETELFKKNLLLYGIHQTKKDIKEKNAAILLEGPVDVISSFQHGIRNVCAVQGTSLTAAHLQMLKRLTPNVIFCFDQDKAGSIALKKSYFLAVEAGVNPKVIQLTQAKDVDEKANKDEKGFNEEMRASMDIIEYIIKRAITEGNIRTADGRAALKNELKPFIDAVPEKLKKYFYIRELASLIDEKESILLEEFKLPAQPSPQYSTRLKPKDNKKKREYIRSKYLLTILLQYYDKIPDLIKTLDPTLMETANLERIVIDLQHAAVALIPIREFIETREEIDKKICIFLMTNQEAQNVSNDIDKIREEVKITAALLQKIKITKELTALRNELWINEKEQKEDEALLVLQKISVLTQEQQALNLLVDTQGRLKQ